MLHLRPRSCPAGCNIVIILARSGSRGTWLPRRGGKQPEAAESHLFSYCGEQQHALGSRHGPSARTPIRRQQVFEEAASRRRSIPDEYMLLNKQWVGRQSVRPSSRGLTDRRQTYVSPPAGQKRAFADNACFSSLKSTFYHGTRAGPPGGPAPITAASSRQFRQSKNHLPS